MKTTLNNSLRLLRDVSVMALMTTATYLYIADTTKTKEIPKCYMHTETIETAKDIQLLLHEQTKLLHQLSLSTTR